MKRPIMALLLAAALVAMPCAAFAASSYGGRDNAENSRSSGGGGGGGGGSSSGAPVVSTSAGSTTSNGIVETLNVSITTPAGVTFVSGASYTRLSDGVVTALVSPATSAEAEAVSPNLPYEAVAAGKTAGLPEDVVMTISNLDQGILSVPGMDLSGYRTFGTTIAVRAEAGATAQIYCSEIPSGGAQILYYDNWTMTWMLLPCTVDAANSCVAFTVPTSGTAIIIGY